MKFVLSYIQIMAGCPFRSAIVCNITDFKNDIKKYKYAKKNYSITEMRVNVICYFPPLLP